MCINCPASTTYAITSLQGFSVLLQKPANRCIVMGGSPASAIRNVAKTAPAEQTNRRVPYPRQRLGPQPPMQAIFTVTPITHIMNAVLNDPMLPHQAEEGCGIRSRGNQARHDRDPLFRPRRMPMQLSTPTHPAHLLHILPAPYRRKVGLQLLRWHHPQFTDFQSTS